MTRAYQKHGAHALEAALKREIGTITAEDRPLVILTSNRTRDLHDAFKRRCLYHWIEYPSLEREIEILKARAPDVPPPSDCAQVEGTASPTSESHGAERRVSAVRGRGPA